MQTDYLGKPVGTIVGLKNLGRTLFIRLTNQQTCTSNL